METTYRVSASNTAEITIRQRWKAFTAQGRTAISQIRIPYEPAFEDVEFKYVKTLKKDGSTVDGDPAGAFDVAASDGLAAFFTDSKWRTILPPNFETGDSVEYEAVRRLRQWPTPGDFWIVHDLTTSVPVLSETVVLDLPAGREVALLESQTIPGKTEIVNGRRIERWVLANHEPAKAGVEATAPLFAVSSILSWDGLGAWMYSLNKSAAAPAPEIAALAAKLTADKSTGQERITALYTYVATKVRYVSVSFGLGRFAPHAASAVLHNAYGDCKDQTALLSALLTAAGFQPHAVLITPAIGVRVPRVPAPDQFSHEFTAVETKSGLIFLDTSMGPAPPQVLPPGVRGRSALLVGEKTSTIIDIPMQSPVPARLTSALKGKVTAAGVFEGSTLLEVQGIAEPVVRRIFLDSSEVEKEKILQQFAGPELRNANVRQISSADPDDLTKPFRVECQLSEKNFFPPARTSMRIMLSVPSSLAELDAVKKPDNPLPLEPFVANMSMDLAVDTSLLISDGMPVHIKTAFGTFDSEFSYRNGHLILTRSLEFNGAAIAPSDWDKFISFMHSVIEETARGFTLERHTPSPAVTGLSQSIQEGRAAFQRRDYEAAKRAYLEATRLDPKSRSAWDDLGRAYAALHEYTAAERAYKRQIEINPNDVYAYNDLGLLYRALKRDDDAIAYFRKQIGVVPRDRYAHQNLSVSLAAKNQWQQAREEAAIAADITPEDAAKWARLGRAEIKTGHIDEARKSFARALAQVHDAMVENNIAYYMADAGIDLDKAWLLVLGTLNPEARLACEPATLSEDDKCSAQLRRIALMLDTAGWVLFRQGKFTEAEPYLSSSYVITPRASTEVHLSAILARSGRLDESLKYFAYASSRADFSRVESSEVRRELANALGGEQQLDSRLKQIQPPVASPGPAAHITALVDGQGKVLDAKSADPRSPGSLVDQTKSLKLPPISWPEHSIKSVRTIGFRQTGAGWSPIQSFVGSASEPPVIR